MSRFLAHAVVAVCLSLLSTFVGERSAQVAYSDIMGCETGCEVVATGWPFVFVRDFPGMSVVNKADITEVWFAADRFDWPALLADLGFWAALSLGGTALMTRLGSRRRSRD